MCGANNLFACYRSECKHARGYRPVLMMHLKEKEDKKKEIIAAFTELLNLPSGISGAIVYFAMFS